MSQLEAHVRLTHFVARDETDAVAALFPDDDPQGALRAQDFAQRIGGTSTQIHQGTQYLHQDGNWYIHGFKGPGGDHLSHKPRR